MLLVLITIYCGMIYWGKNDIFKETFILIISLTDTKEISNNHSYPYLYVMYSILII